MTTRLEDIRTWEGFVHLVLRTKYKITFDHLMKVISMEKVGLEIRLTVKNTSTNERFEYILQGVFMMEESVFVIRTKPKGNFHGFAPGNTAAFLSRQGVPYCTDSDEFLRFIDQFKPHEESNTVLNGSIRSAVLAAVKKQLFKAKVRIP